MYPVILKRFEHVTLIFLNLILQLFESWCTSIQREDFLAKDIATVRKGYRVCDDHFEESAKFTDNKNRTNLKYGSIPLFRLPGKLRTISFISEIFVEIGSTIILVFWHNCINLLLLV